jgi:acetyltransferase-like isoleucine patch superfamily enzyme
MDIREQIRQLLETDFGIHRAMQNCGTSLPAVSPDATIGAGVRIGRDVIIHERVQIGDGVRIGDRVVLFNCKLGDGVCVEDNSIVGYRTLTGGFSHQLEEFSQLHKTVIGEGTLIRTGCTIYQSVAIGKQCWINHGVLLRENTSIGDHTCIGSMSDSEGYNHIGSHVLIHSQVHLCARLVVEDYVFIAPFTVFANGNPMNYARDLESREQGATVRFGAQIGANVVVMPRVEIGYESVVGPSSVVNRDVPSLTIVSGHPARPIGPVTPEMRIQRDIRSRYYGEAAEPPSTNSDLVMKRRVDPEPYEADRLVALNR